MKRDHSRHDLASHSCIRCTMTNKSMILRFPLSAARMRRCSADEKFRITIMLSNYPSTAAYQLGLMATHIGDQNDQIEKHSGSAAWVSSKRSIVQREISAQLFQTFAVNHRLCPKSLYTLLVTLLSIPPLPLTTLFQSSHSDAISISTLPITPALAIRP